VIAQLVQALGTADHQNAIERRLEGRLRQYSITPAAPAREILQESPRITREMQCTEARVWRGGLKSGAGPSHDVDGQSRQSQVSACFAASDG
jgi:hypothetical protein